ncbi:MAG: helix-turn-helix domain-containing protein [Thermoplasmata archaeon]
MSFEILLKGTPPIYENDLDTALIQFLTMIGYLSESHDKRTRAASIKESVGYRIIRDCFIRNMERGWKVKEICAMLSTTPPTVWRYLNKLKGLDLLEEVPTEDGTKGYRIRYGNFAMAWNFVEANTHNVLENYKKMAEHIQKLIQSR